MQSNKNLLFFIILAVSLVMLMSDPAFSLVVAQKGTEAKEEKIKGIGSRKKKVHRVPMIPKAKIKVDGVLDDGPWQQALVLHLDFEREPGENIAPPVKTEVRLLTTGSHLYVAFRANDPKPDQIRSRLTDRDKIWNDDYVGINLDTFNDARHFYGFYSNPYGIQGDQSVALGEYQKQWDAIWGSAGKITNEGYVVEMSIPFSSLRFQRGDKEQVWGLDLLRNYPRSLNHTIGLWPRDRSSTCYMCQADSVVGFKGAKPGTNIELNPTISAVLNQERSPFPDGKMEKRDSKINPGITAQWGFTPNLILSAAVNPDFSHVEADAAQLDINTPFTLFYPEKRPFFLEGASIFLTPFFAVYSRSLKDPDWGIKLTGKEGKSTIGFFSVQDSETLLILPTAEYSNMTVLNQSNVSTAIRYKHDVGKASGLGIMITDREGKNYYNRLAGVDGDLKLTKSHYFVFQFLGSQTKYPGEVAAEYGQSLDKFEGTALALQYMYFTKNVMLYAQHYSITSGFRSDVGFNEWAGARYSDFTAQYRWRRNPGHWFTSLSLGGTGTYSATSGGDMLTKGVNAYINYSGPLQSSIYLNFKTGKSTFLGAEFDDTHVSLSASLRPSGSVYLSLYGKVGDQIDYSNIRQGKSIMFQPGFQYNAGKHLRLELDHVYQRLEAEGAEVYTANLSNARVVYQFNSRAFLRAILQYADYKYNSANYSYPQDPRFKHLFSQILFSYKVNPRTVLFLGYSDDYYGYRYIPLKQKNRTFFLKVGYALVL